jgi:phenylacetate-coenzyme A ligase PaaK-like adenylate-forming protein
MLGDEQRGRRLKIEPKTIIATGETVTKADAQFLSASFPGASALSMYACTEHMLLGMSNADGDTMTLLDDNLILEFYEDHSLVTNLFNHTLPLIRYRMSDILRPISPPGAPRILVENLVGRTERLPLFRNAAGAQDFISPHTINEIFVRGVTRFQMQITGASSFRFPICVEAELSAERRMMAVEGVKARLAEILAQKGLSNVTFDVPIVTEIPLNKRTRKFQLIVNQSPD